MTTYLRYTDDYREGPRIHVEKDNDDDDIEVCEFQFKRGKTFRVYYATMIDGGYQKKIARFNTQKEAYQYCVYQYKLYNDSGPFIPNGEYSGFYHPKGSHQNVEVPKNIELEIPVSDDPWREFLVIVNKDTIKTYSLQHGSVWYS